MSREGFPIRLGAGLIDAMAINLAVVPFLLAALGRMLVSLFHAILIPFTDGKSATQAEASAERGLIWGLVALGIYLALTATEVLCAAGPGKLLIGLRIRNADGAPASAGQLLGRWLVKHAALVFVILALALGGGDLGNLVSGLGLLISAVIAAGFLMTLGEQRQALHDRICGTAVFRVAAASASLPKQ